MMIRINLLPVRQVQKREAGRQYIIVLVGIAVIALIGNGYWYYSLDSELADRQRKLNDTNARIQQLEKVIGEVNNLNKRKKEVEEKLSVLDKLRKQRGGPVKLLDALATSIPKKVWLTSFEEKGGAVKVTGGADSFEDVSEFMRGLNNAVWTPKGMGRIVEMKRDGSAARVELLSEDSAIEDFAGSEVAHFFSNIELKGSESTAPPANAGRTNRLVKFELSLNVNYAI
ncbi:MAG: PilN domain-containing protein [Myxococcota bacterium]|jgi:type IV pilus assembly protein PilN